MTSDSEKSYEILTALWLFGYSNAGFLISDGNLLRSNRKPIPTGNCNAKCGHDGILAIQVTYFVWARALRAHGSKDRRQSDSGVEYKLLK